MFVLILKILLKFLFSKPYDFVNKIYYLCLNFLRLKIYRVNYKTFPRIAGDLIIINRGICFLGNEVVFNSSIKSNLVGLFKPCTITILNGAELRIGNYTGFSGVSIYCSCNISIGNYCNFGGNTSIWDTDFHPINYIERRVTIDGAKRKAIIIGDDVFIGANVIILKGVTIGNRSIIGAGSVITVNIPDDEIWAGNPAKFIRTNKIK